MTAAGLTLSDIEAGRDVTVTINQLPLPQAAELTHAYQDFSHELGLAAGFVGRRALFAELAAFQDFRSHGYLRLTAGPGLGKTAVAAEVARRFSAEAFFVNAGSGLVTAEHCLGHLCAALIRRFGLPYERLPVPLADSSFFSRVLRLAAAAADGPVWLVVDALDEAADPGPTGNVLLLPPSLPPGVFVFVTQRPGPVPLRTSPDTTVADLVIRGDSEEDRVDLRDFLAGRTARPEIAARLAAAVPPVPPETFVAGVLEASQGNFMFASFLLGDIADGTRSAGSTDLAALPRGLSGYYTEMWRRMVAVARQDGTEQWERVYRPAVELLAVAGEPVTAEWLASLLGVPTADVRTRVLRAWRRFIVATGERGRERWRFVHRSFHDFLVEQDEVYLPEAHAKVAAAFAAPPTWREFDGYPLRHQLMHLAESGDLAAASALVRGEPWYAAQLDADRTATVMRAGVSTVLSAVAAANDADVAAGRPAHHLGDEIWLRLYAHTLTGYLRGIRPRTLRLFVETGALSDDQALSVLERDPRVGGRGPALTALADVLGTESLDAAWHVALTLPPEDERIGALLALSERIPADVTGPVLEAELRSMLIRTTAAAEAVDHLGELLAAVPAADVEPEIRHAVGMATADPDEERRPQRLAALVSGLGFASPPGVEAAVALHGSLDPAEGLDPYLIALGVLPEILHEDLVEVALPLAMEAAEPDARADGLIALVPYLDAAARGVTIAAALEDCRRVESPKRRMEKLVELLDVTEDADTQWAIIGAARETVPMIEHAPWRASSLGPFIARFTAELAEEFLDRAESALREVEPGSRFPTLVELAELLEDGPLRTRLSTAALLDARAVDDDLARARALLTVAVSLPVQQARPVVSEVVAMPGGMQAAWYRHRDADDRALLLAGVAAALPSESRAAAAESALALTDVTSQAYDRGRVLVALLPALAGSRRADVVTELRELWDRVTAAGERTELGSALLRETPRADREELFQQVLDAALGIEPGDISMVVSVEDESHVVVPGSLSPLMGRPTEALAQLARLDHSPERRARLTAIAFDAVYDTPDDLQHEAIDAIAPDLDLDQCERILEEYRLILTDPRRRAMVEGIELAASALDFTPPDLPATTDSEPGPDGGHTTVSANVHVVADHVFGLSRVPRQDVVSFESADLGRFPAEKRPGIELALIRQWAGGIALGGGDEVFELVDAARDFATGRTWPPAVGKVLRRLAGLTSIEHALARADGVWPDGWPPVVAAMFAEHRAVDVDELAAVADPGTRLAALAISLRGSRVPRPILADALSAWLDTRPPGYDPLTTDLLAADGLAPALRLQLIRYRLDLSRARHELLRAATKVLDAILDLGGPDTARILAAAVEDISHRWPQ